MAAAYLRTVSLWMPNSLAMPRRDSPRRLALWTEGAVGRLHHRRPWYTS